MQMNCCSPVFGRPAMAVPCGASPSPSPSPLAAAAAAAGSASGLEQQRRGRGRRRLWLQSPLGGRGRGRGVHCRSAGWRRASAGAGGEGLRWSERQRAWTDGDGPPRRTGRGSVATKALPIDSYWVTALQAVTVAGLMAGFAVFAGIFINMKVELRAMAEYLELEKKGQLPQDLTIPEDGVYDLDEPLFIFKSKDLLASGPSRNRPIREESQPEIKPELEPELKTVGTKK